MTRSSVVGAGVLRRRPHYLSALLLAAAIPCAIAAVAPSAAPTATAAPDDRGAQPRVVLETDAARVSQLILEPGADTGQHAHANPHIAVALTGGELIDIAADGGERRRPMIEGALAFVPAGVTHTLRNGGADRFRAVTIDLLQPQSGARNRCASLLPGRPIDCPKPAMKPKDGALVPQMETDETLVSLLTLAPGAKLELKAAAMPPVVVSLAGSDESAPAQLKAHGAIGWAEKPLHGGEAAAGMAGLLLTIRNTGSRPARFVVVEFR